MKKVIVSIPEINYPLVVNTKGGKERNVNNDSS